MKIAFKTRLNDFLKKPLVGLILTYISVTIILSLLGLSYFSEQKNKIINDRYEYLGSTAEFRMSQVIQWLKEKYSDLEILKVSSPLLNLSKTKLTSQLNVSPEIKSWFGSLRRYYGYDDIIIADHSEKLIYSLSSSKKYFTKIDSSLCRLASDSNMVLFSDSDERTTVQTALKFYIPLEEKNSGEKRNGGVLVLILEPKKNFDPILNQNIDKSPTLESLLVKTIGDSVVYLNSLRVDRDKNVSSLPLKNKALTSANAIEGRRNFVEGIDYKNEEVIAVIQKVPSSSWFLITKIDKSEFYQPVNDFGKIVFLAATSSDFLLAIILFFFWRKNIFSNYKRRYEAEIEKLKLENRFEALINEVRDYAIFMLDAGGNVISWNEGSKKIKGYNPEEVIGKHFSIFYTEEDKIKNKPSNELEFAVKNGSFEEEGWKLKKDGSLFWANVVITSLKDDKGKLYGFLEVTRDLTERKKAEEEIRKSRDFYLKLLDDFPNPVWRSGLDGKCNYFNKAWLNFTGRSLDQEIGDGWAANLHPEDTEKVMNKFYTAFKQQRSFTLEYRMKNSEGHFRWLIDFGMPYYDMDGNFAGYLGSRYDNDDRKKYEETINTLLRISEKLYSSLEIEQITDFLVTESIQLVNAESGFACLMNEKEFETNRYYYKDHWEYLNKIYPTDDALLKRFIADKESYTSVDTLNDDLIDKEIVNRYGIKQILSTPLFGSAGELIGFFEIHNKKNNKVFNNDDINLLRAVARNASISIAKSLNYEKLRQTELQLRKSESELRNLAAQIQYAREAERQHIAREVHDELGQLFTGINLNVSLLTEMLEQTKKPSLVEILDELRSVQIFVNKGIQMVRDISGSLRSYVLDHLGLIPAIHEYCREIERISNIKCNFKSELESFNLDEERNVALFRIIQEALTNAIRHADANIIDVKIMQSKDNLDILVSDNGKGIRESSEIRTNSMGILGMKERTIFLGGKLNIESIEGEGTKIHLLIPFEKEPNPEG